MQNSFNKYIEQTIQKHWDLPALTDFQGATYHYKDVARRMAKIHIMLEAAGIKHGDKVAMPH